MTGFHFVRWAFLGFFVSTTLAAGQGGAQENRTRPIRQSARGLTAEEARTQMVDEEIVAAGREEPAGDRRHAGHAATRVHSGQALAQRLLRHGPADRRRADDLSALHRGLHDRGHRSAAQGQSPGNRHGQRLPGGRLERPGPGSLFDRDRPIARQAGRPDPQAAEVRERACQGRRRIPRLARTRPLRQDHRHLLSGKGAAGPGRPAQGGRADRDPRRPALSADAVSVKKTGGKMLPSRCCR